jgi:hypothetical protein
MKSWLEKCSADGGGDAPEAVADALHDVLKLSWRAEATKICILISDAPPHGLDSNGDGFPQGCPCKLDPIKIVQNMAEKTITLYTVGVEPPISQFSEPFSFISKTICLSLFLVPYRDFFMTLAYITGGQYVPMVNAQLLAQVIIGGVREEISLDRLMQGAQEDIDREMQRAEAEGVDDEEKAKRLNQIFASKNMHCHKMKNDTGTMSKTVTDVYSKMSSMTEMQTHFMSKPKATFDDITEEDEVKKAADITYDLTENADVSIAQSKRLLQKLQHRKK